MTAALAPGRSWRERVQALPRDSRDTLFLLAVMAWTVAPHASHLPWWALALVAAVLLWRGWLALRQRALPGRRAVALALVVAMGLTWLSLGTLLGQNAGVTLLVVLMALKTLELRARRDALVVFFLGFFLVLTNFLFSQSLLVALAMVGSVWGLLTALTLAHMPSGRPPLWDAARVAGRAAALGAPVMLLLFMLFPRFGPLWSSPSDTLGRTGLSDQLRMGAMAEIANDDSIAMRVRFEGPVPPANQLYFRGPVLTRFDGVEWRPALRPRSALPRPGEDRPTPMDGPGLAYEMTLEPTQATWLPMLEHTPDLPTAAPRLEGHTVRAQAGLQWRTERPVHARLRFTARAWPNTALGPLRGDLFLREDVDLPSSYNPRSMIWASNLRRSPALAEAAAPVVVQALLDHIRSEPFSYTLAPGLYGRDAVDEFWFDRRQGFCEHFAAALVVMLRAMDVPARIVTGYQGADAQSVDGYFIVRQRHAHAWAEYWAEGIGWVRVDPTAAVAPDRIDLSQPLPMARGLVGTALSNWNPAVLTSAREAWEAMNNRWNQWVLDYSRASQFKLLESLGVRSPKWEDMAMALILTLTFAALAGTLWVALDRRRQDPWQRMQRHINLRLARLAVAAATQDTPRALALRVAAQHGERGQALCALLHELERLRYAPQANKVPPPSWRRRFDAACAGLAA